MSTEISLKDSHPKDAGALQTVQAVDTLEAAESESRKRQSLSDYLTIVSLLSCCRCLNQDSDLLTIIRLPVALP